MMGRKLLAARRRSLLRRPREEQAGQVIVIFALGLVALLLIAGLVLDVARVYSLQRYERSVADAAALAGAQDLQDPGAMTISSGDYPNARADALRLVTNSLGGSASGSGCDTSNNITDCPLTGTSYHVAIMTPYPGAIDVDGSRAVKVTVWEQDFPLVFAPLSCVLNPCSAGYGSWNPGIASVAGLSFGGKYAVVTLQPSHTKHDGSDANLNTDLVVNGNNTLLNIVQGDVGTNTSATTNNQGSNPAYIKLAPCFFIDHMDDLSLVGITWLQKAGTDCSGNPAQVPIGKRIYRTIPDPNYLYPNWTAAAVQPGGSSYFTSQAAGQTPCTGADYPSDWTSVLVAGSTTCYKPGIYNLGSQRFTIGNGTAYLMPGAYYFESGLTMGGSNGSLAGGLITGRQGVVVEFPQNQVFDATAAQNLILNAGSFSCQGTPNTCRANPATDFAGTVMKTPGNPPRGGFPLTVEVDRQGACFNGTTPLDPQVTPTCTVGQNTTVKLAGGGYLVVAGVLYGPSDNMNINGNASQEGVVGQIYSWTVTYTGGSTLSQEYPGAIGNGTLRLDTACSPGVACP